MREQGKPHLNYVTMLTVRLHHFAKTSMGTGNKMGNHGMSKGDEFLYSPPPNQLERK